MNGWLKLDKNEWILELECKYSTNMSFSSVSHQTIQTFLSN